MSNRFIAILAGAALLSLSRSVPASGPQWTASYEGSASASADFVKVVPDPDGNLYVLAREYAANVDFVLLKYAPSGALLWSHRQSGAVNGWDYPGDLTLDREGDPILTGYSTGATGADYSTVKYDPQGNMLWKTHNDSTVAVPAGYAGLQADDFAHSVAVDAQDNIYVAGLSFGGVTGTPDALSVATDLVLVKYSAAGHKLWAVRRHGQYSSITLKVAADPAGNAVVGASEYYTQTSGGATVSSYNYLVLEYGPTGTPRWTKHYNARSHHDAFLSDIAVDAAGNVYATGSSTGFGTVKYRQDGATLWSYYDAGQTVGAAAIALDGTGNAAVCGGPAAECYGPSGALRWQQTYSNPDNLPGYDTFDARALTFSPSGTLWIAGQAVSNRYTAPVYRLGLAAYDGAGALLQHEIYADGRQDAPEYAAVTLGGDIVVSGVSRTDLVSRAILLDYAAL